MKISHEKTRRGYQSAKRKKKANGLSHLQPGATPQVSQFPMTSTLKGWRKSMPMRKAFSLDSFLSPVPGALPQARDAERLQRSRQSIAFSTL